MSVLILGDPQGWYVRELQSSASRLGVAVQVLPFERLAASLHGSRWTPLASEEVNLTKIQTVIVRSMPPGSLEQVIFRMDVLWSFEQAGVNVINSPKSLECAIDKYLTLVRLQRAGLPVPRTVVSETTDQAMAGFDVLDRDVVVKPIFGAEGRGILRINDPDHAWRIFRSLEQTGQVIYQQEFLDHGGSDLRLLLLDGKPLAAMKRISSSDFRTNLARSGSAQAYLPTDEELHIATRSSAAVVTRFAGIDLIRTRAGSLYVIEVNAVPGWKGLQQTTNIPIAEFFWKSVLDI